jgi:hypothetical protein
VCIVCVELCAVFRLIVVLFLCVMCVTCMLCLSVVRLPPGKNPFAVKINNNHNNNKLGPLCNNVGHCKLHCKSKHPANIFDVFLTHRSDIQLRIF